MRTTEPTLPSEDGIDPKLLREYLNSIEQQAAEKAAGSFERISEAERQRQLMREEWEKQRRAELMEKLYGDYVVGAKGDWRDKRSNRLMFSVENERIKTDRNDDQTMQAMLDYAQAKGWKSLRVNGDAEFRRSVWMEANLRGLEVEGYKPREADRAELDERRSLRSRNSVGRGTRNADADTQKKPEPPKASKEEILHGTLLSHGVANKDFRASGESSYYVRVDTPLGVKVAWGKDLQRAMDESKAKPGDQIYLDNVDYRNVDVKDADKAQPSASERALASAANQLVNQHVRNPNKRDQYVDGIRAELEQRREKGTMPQVHIYDRDAPAQAREVAAPVVERHSERTR